jgi:hypothetical protein
VTYLADLPHLNLRLILHHLDASFPLVTHVTRVSACRVGRAGKRTSGRDGSPLNRKSWRRADMGFL